MMKSLFRVGEPIRCGLVWCGLNPINTGPKSDLLRKGPGDSFVFYPLWLVQGQGRWLIRSGLIHTLRLEHYQPHLAHSDHQEVWLFCLRYIEHTQTVWTNGNMQIFAVYFIPAYAVEEEKSTSLLFIPFRIFSHRPQQNWTQLSTCANGWA